MVILLSGEGRLKKPVPIDRLLQWAYRDELPKGYRPDDRYGVTPAISPMFRFANLGGPVDNWSREPGFPLAMGTEPHPDALSLHNAVMGVDDTAIAFPDQAHSLLGELAAFLTPEETPAVAAMRAHTAGLVTLHARMGNRPIWQVDYSFTREVGRDRNAPIRKGKARKHLKATQGELRILPRACEILCARFEYCAWHAALSEIAAALSGSLRDHVPLPPECPPTPWIDGEPEPARILNEAAATMNARELATGRLSVLPKLPLKPARPMAGPPLLSDIEESSRRGLNRVRRVLPETDEAPC